MTLTMVKNNHSWLLRITVLVVDIQLPSGVDKFAKEQFMMAKNQADFFKLEA